MKETVSELRKVISEYAGKFNAIPESELAAKPSLTKWSKKEVIGHLIDSAHNNLRRFIVAQYESVPSQIVYEQDAWVASNHYQDAPKEDVITLWKLLNERIIAVLENMPEENYGKQSLTSRLHSIEFLAGDYVRHLKHHINQVLAGSFDIIYKS